MVAPVRRAGFSLIEALVVLAVGGLALAVIFSIGIKAGDSGFALGRRAMSAADTDVAVGDVRATLRSLALRPRETFLADVDRPMSGQAERLEVDVVMERATQCAPQGWAGRLVLAIETRDGERVLSCTAGGATTRMMTLAPGPAGFTYSTDGVIWTPAYANTPAPRGEAGLRPLDLWVRLDAPGLKIIEMASSGRPEPWVRGNDFAF